MNDFFLENEDITPLDKLIEILQHSEKTYVKNTIYNLLKELIVLNDIIDKNNIAIQNLDYYIHANGLDIENNINNFSIDVSSQILSQE